MYSDTKPHRHHIADLQKGLVLVYKGKELVGEGTGFGVPVARYQNKECFSGSSTLRIFHKDECTVAIKKFVLDTVSEKRFGKVKVENRMVRQLSELSGELYRKHKHWRPILQRTISRSIGLQTMFVRTKPRGKVVLTYLVDPPRIHVKADFASLERGNLQKIFLLNEQGSSFFGKYFDSNGMVLFDKQIGAWENVEANWACISNKNGEVGFRLWKTEGTTLHRGREFLERTYDWVGLDYELASDKSCFEYEVEIFGSPEQR